MFGSKQAKQDRLEQIVQVLEGNPGGLTQSEIARRVRRQRSTVHRDLLALDKRGVLLAEDERGRVSLFRRLFGQH
jgi:DNA-binding IclR family transcriptional regulator